MKLRLEFKSIAWWYWVASWLFIVAGLAGWEPGFFWVTALSAWQILHFVILEKSLTLFPVQVRMGFFLISLAGLWPPLRFIYWIPAIGLFARVTIDYCLLARLMSLFPWNRKEPLTWDFIRRRIFSPPTNGSVCP